MTVTNGLRKDRSSDSLTTRVSPIILEQPEAGKAGISETSSRSRSGRGIGNARSGQIAHSQQPYAIEENAAQYQEPGRTDHPAGLCKCPLPSVREK